MITALSTFGTALAGTVGEPIFLRATDFAEGGGRPSLVVWDLGSSKVPVWSFSGMTAGQSVAALTPPLPKECAGVRIELSVANQEVPKGEGLSDVFRTHISQVPSGNALPVQTVAGTPVATRIQPRANSMRSIVAESYCRVVGGCPLVVRVQREPENPNDTFTRPVGLVSVTVTPLKAPPRTKTVEGSPGYNSWPMITALGSKLVCAYSRGKDHNIAEGERGVYARTSADGGTTWTDEMLVANDPACGEVTIGKGLDGDGAMLLWVRCMSESKKCHDLYRTLDGVRFEKIASPEFDPFPMQVTDVFQTESGLMSLWFATYYGKDGANNSWGTLTSVDNGKTWIQHTVESGLTLGELPTEPSAVALGNGRILAIARNEGGPTSESTQFQLTSTDDGETWKRARTNIRDVFASTPSLVLDQESGLVYNYYYERGRRVLKRRVVTADDVFERPYAWPEAEVVAFGDEDRPWDAGNVNVTTIGKSHYAAFYHGRRTQAAVILARASVQLEGLNALNGTAALKASRRLVWSDEFDGTDLDPKKWSSRKSMNSDDCLYANDARTYEVKDSMLFLHVRPSPDPSKRCLLPMGIATHDTMAFKYGYLEMRAKVPFKHGAWPSFWMQSTPRLQKCPWMSEVDIFENFSSTDSVIANLHKWHFGEKAKNVHVMLPNDERGQAPWRTHRFADPARLNEEFHTYGLEWTPTEMAFFVDGIRFAHVAIDEAHDYSPNNALVSGMVGHQDYHSIILNNEVFTPGHGWCPGGYELKPEDLPIHYQVDWIRLWQKDGEHLRLLSGDMSVRE